MQELKVLLKIIKRKVIKRNFKKCKKIVKNIFLCYNKKNIKGIRLWDLKKKMKLR